MQYSVRSPQLLDDIEVNVPQVLERLRLEGEVIQQEFVTLCVFHNETGAPNLEINTRTGLWHCWVCGERGNLPRLVMLTQGATYKDAVDIISEYGSVLDVVSMRNRSLAQLDAILNPPRHHFKTVDITRYRKGKSWWWYNGIPFGRFSRKTVERFYLGYDGVSKRAVIPVRAEGKWVGIIRRAVNQAQRPRYLYSKDFDRRHVLYGLSHVASRYDNAVVVEGAKDALRAYEYGLGNFVATLGTGLTREQLALLADRFDEVTVFCDNDAPGHIAQFKMCQDLAERIPRVFVVQWRTHRKDPNELTEPVMRKMLSRRVHWAALLEPGYDPFVR
jgi:DNA primase